MLYLKIIIYCADCIRLDSEMAGAGAVTVEVPKGGFSFELCHR